MSLNWPATIALVAGVCFRPRLIVPHLSVRDVRQLDFAALRRSGYDGAIFDKDNCLTLPLNDALIPDLQDAWAECKTAFGPARVIVVSNSAGTPDDPGGIQAESVAHRLGVHVLEHASKKPGWACVQDVRAYFAAHPCFPQAASPSSADVPRGKLLVVGDRLFTDVVLARRLASARFSLSRASTPAKTQTLAVLVEPWDSADARLLRLAERFALRLARRITGLQDTSLHAVKGSGREHVGSVEGVRVLKGWEDEVRPFVRAWDPMWSEALEPVDELRRERGAATWEGK